ncbi:MAG: hypothetical protein Fur0043_18650 [Anaerolineales bacterium]
MEVEGDRIIARGRNAEQTFALKNPVTYYVTMFALLSFDPISGGCAFTQTAHLEI